MEVEVIVEIPRGSRNKYEMDHDSDAVWLDRTLFTSMQYPADYGFFPHTLADDGATCRIVSSTSCNAAESPQMFSSP